MYFDSIHHPLVSMTALFPLFPTTSLLRSCHLCVYFENLVCLIRISCQQGVTYKDRATLPVTTPLGNAPFLLQPPLNTHGAFGGGGGCSKNS